MAATAPEVTTLIALVAVRIPGGVAAVVDTINPIPAAIGAPLLTPTRALALAELDVVDRTSGETCDDAEASTGELALDSEIS